MIFALVKSFWLDFAGRQSWHFLLYKAEYGFCPNFVSDDEEKDLQRSQPLESLEGSCVHHGTQGGLGDLGWCHWREKVSKGSHSCFTRVPPALPEQPRSDMERQMDCIFHGESMCFPLTLLSAEYLELVLSKGSLLCHLIELKQLDSPGFTILCSHLLHQDFAAVQAVVSHSCHAPDILIFLPPPIISKFP